MQPGLCLHQEVLVHHGSHPSKQLLLGDACPWLPCAPTPLFAGGCSSRGAAQFSSNHPCHHFKHASTQIEHQLSLPFAFPSP